MSDGPSGVRGQRFAGGPPSVSFPCGAALGATWDVELVARVGSALAEEARAKGAHVVLGPTVNLQRTPLGGRHFECFSEDPMLSAELAVAYVEGLQGEGVAACVKHLVANDQEHDRFEVSSEPDERTLREVSLLPFEHALRRAGAWSTMAAYNRLHGTHCSQHQRLLSTILRDEWGWDGVVISDWFAVHATVEPALAGLDLEMPGPALHWGAALAAAIDAGDVPVEVIEEKRERLARPRARARVPTVRPPATTRPVVPRARSRSLERPRRRRSCCCATRACCRSGRGADGRGRRSQRRSRGDPGRRQRPRHARPTWRPWPTGCGSGSAPPSRWSPGRAPAAARRRWTAPTCSGPTARRGSTWRSSAPTGRCAPGCGRATSG